MVYPLADHKTPLNKQLNGNIMAWLGFVPQPSVRIFEAIGSQAYSFTHKP